MQIDFDPQADAIYIRFREGEIDDTVAVNRYIYVDVDKEKSPLGLEILFASRVLKNQDITTVTLNIGRTPPGNG